MKRVYVLLVLFCSVLFVTGCSKNLNDQRVIYPVDELAELNANPDLYFLAQNVFETAGLSTDGIVLVNRPEMLQEVVLEDMVYSWPEMDLTQYSLVVGRYSDNSTGYYLADQWILKEGKTLKLYAEIKMRGGIHTRMTRVFVALYPKLPDGEVEFVRWDKE